MNRKLAKTLLAAVGILAIVLSIVVFTLNVGEDELNEFYGGDAYTGIQQAAAQSANNVRKLAKICRFGFGSVLIVTGLAMVGAAVCITPEEPEFRAAPEVNPVQKENTPSDPAAGSWTCPDCGKQNESCDIYCKGCGKYR